MAAIKKKFRGVGKGSIKYASNTHNSYQASSVFACLQADDGAAVLDS